MKMTLDPELAQETKALVTLAFRNGPHRRPARRNTLPAMQRQSGGLAHLDEEMKRVMKSAVDTLYRLLWLRKHDPEKYAEQLAFGQRYTLRWDDPEIRKPARNRMHTE